MCRGITAVVSLPAASKVYFYTSGVVLPVRVFCTIRPDWEPTTASETVRARLFRYRFSIGSGYRAACNISLRDRREPNTFLDQMELDLRRCSSLKERKCSLLEER